MSTRLYTYQDPSEKGSTVYGFWIDYCDEGREPEIMVSSCELFDRETYEEFSACAIIDAESFMKILQTGSVQDGAHTAENERGYVTVFCEKGEIKRIEYSGGESTGNKYPQGLKAAALLAEIEKVK